MRRHHLIEEAKAELDVAYEEVKRAEQGIMNLEMSYNEKIKGLNGATASNDVSALMAEKEKIQDGFGIEELYAMQSTAVERFAVVSTAFTIVSSIEDETMSVDLIRNILLRKAPKGARKVEFDRAVREFSRGLRAYMRTASSAENDRNVRQCWVKIEEILRESGRHI
jgi:hypothetical protein